MNIECDEFKNLTLSIATTPFLIKLLGDNGYIAGMVLLKMLRRMPFQKQRQNMSLTEMNLKEVIKEIHEPATLIKRKDWHYVLNFTGINNDEEIKERFKDL
jgi:hypothetical protein